jgi:hypothetical protein
MMTSTLVIFVCLLSYIHALPTTSTFIPSTTNSITQATNSITQAAVFVADGMNTLSTTVNSISEAVVYASQSPIFCNNTIYCPQNSECNPYNGTIGMCECTSHYATLDGDAFCQYSRKSLITALLLDIFLDWLFPIGQIYFTGVTHQTVYSNKIVLAEILTSGMTGLCVFYVVGILFSLLYCSSKNLSYKSVCTVATYFYSVATSAWIIVNIVRISTGAITDENNIGGTW